MKWAIIGTGQISHQFATDAGAAKSAELVAVCSRDIEKGKAFAKEFNIPKVYSDYDEMLANEEIDNIYAGVPHTAHQEVVEYFLKKKKNVLCEKPLGVNKRQAESMIKTAKENDVLLMEAMWTMFFPAVIKAKELIDAKHFGEINSAAGFIGYGSMGNHDRWRYYSHMAGGALLDIGVYPVHFFLHIFGKTPDETVSLADIRDGVDMTDKVAFKFGNAAASFDASILSSYEWRYDIYCERGSIHLNRITAPYTLTLKPFDGEEEVIDFAYERGGMQYQIDAFDEASKKGMKELPPVTHQRTLDALEIMDELREKWGLKYPME
ncbi:MAG: Gfo/Idh/MocA family oxidoreductase [Eubacteriales bacterium]